MAMQDDIRSLLGQPESARLERTDSTATDKLCEAICAFANDLSGTGNAGYLLVGVDDAGRPTGKSIDDDLLTHLSNIPTQGNILPPPSLTVEQVMIDGVAVAVVRVTPSDSPPVAYKGRVHVRRGPAKGIATKEEERRLSERAIDRAKTWDARGCHHSSLHDIALDLFKLSYLPHAVAPEILAENQRTAEEQMASLRLFDLKRGLPTNACVLLFGKDPLEFFQGAYVQIIRYRGADQASEVREARRLTGDLVQVMRGLNELKDTFSQPRPVRQADQTDRTIFDYPPRALLEVFMNAVIHRNYENSTTPTSISVFDDRIEVQSPGGLYGDLTKALFPRGTSYRNPVIAEAAMHLGYVNRYGRGIAITKAEMARNESPEPVFEPGENHMLVVLRRRP